MEEIQKKIREAQKASDSYENAIQVLQWCAEVVKELQTKANEFIEFQQKQLEKDEIPQEQITEITQD